ncbi:hypothetical protein CI238_11476 [Colletotrichum incanum]|uniref:DUF7728 domain-containing protein n=1 Tax=Colletotrichum incanum TaxID=1573173 RepID=A0A166ZHA6_COLIC|nr:hypothetical protein CI238_11476 [Colletotrichum incanum]
MLLKSLAAAAGLAITATQAFVIFPEISEADSDIVNALPFEQSSSETGLASHRVKVDCPGCPLTMRHPDGRYHTMTNIDNHLELTFSIDTDTYGVDHLLVNDFELYPKPASWYKALRAPQIPDFTEAATKHPRKTDPNTPQLGYSLGVRPVAKDDEQQLELVEIDLQIIEVGNSFVSDVPNVNVKLIKSPAGNLMIANVEQTETSVPSHQEEEHVEAPAEDCTTFYCKWRAAILNKMQRMKHCGGRKNHGGMRGQHRHGHHNGQVRHHHHTWGQLAKNIASHILLPVLIGIVAGVSVSIIGMMVGTFVVCLWRVFVRRQPAFARRHCRRRARKSAHREAGAVEEKSGLMAETEDLPPYKDEEEEVPKTETAQV